LEPENDNKTAYHTLEPLKPILLGQVDH